MVPNPEGAPLFSDFNVAIADVDQAIAAMAKHAAVEKGHIRLLRQLSSTEIAALHLKAGEVKSV